MTILTNLIRKMFCLSLYLLILFSIFYRGVIRIVLISSPVCIVNRITFNARITLSVKIFLSSMLSNSKFFIVSLLFLLYCLRYAIVVGSFEILYFGIYKNLCFRTIQMPPFCRIFISLTFRMLKVKIVCQKIYDVFCYGCSTNFRCRPNAKPIYCY